MQEVTYIDLGLMDYKKSLGLPGHPSEAYH